MSSTADPTYETLAAYTNAFHMPFLSPSFPQTNYDRPMQYGISMKPQYLKAIIDIIKFYRWKSILYLYDSDDAEGGKMTEMKKGWPGKLERISEIGEEIAECITS
ncbi:hypothetical protein CDAR_168061 [Caerostris darwini]|uniref:Receptor ligand binding region domain-containing protein n=1 Tax=Caerostris darwini TaxID=1538125 RepID=A0AAV4VJC3_9ARAC|nr:hypothetical protein CDAR_168061 [Caerostris darwini]